MPKILLYNAKTETKTDSLYRVMDRALEGTGIPVEEVTADTLSEQLTNDVALFILPGARAGMAYREQLRGKPFENIRKHIEGGMQVLGICAGAFVLSQEFDYNEYDPSDGQLRESKHVRSELGLAALKAFGPDLRLYHLQPREEENPWSVFTAAEVAFMRDGEKVQASLALSKGPSMQITDFSRCTPLCLYEKTGDVAIASFKHGLGGGILSGPALEVGGHNLIHYVHPRHRDNPAALKTINALEGSSAAWTQLWGVIFKQLLGTHPEAVRKIEKNLASMQNPAAVRQQQSRFKLD